MTTSPNNVAAPASGAEVVLGVLPLLQCSKGPFGQQLFAPVMTSHRVAFALLTKGMQQEAAAEARQDARQPGQGALGQWGAGLASGTRIGQRYLSMPVNVILGEHAENFYLMHDQVQQVRLRDSDPQEPSDRDRVEFHTSAGKQRFTLAYGSLKDVRKALEPVFGKRVR